MPREHQSVINSSEPQQNAAGAKLGPPTRTRFTVLAFLSSLGMVLYLDRVCIGEAVTVIEHDLSLDHADMSWVLGAFVVAYGLFEVPTGHWGDRYGSRGVLTRIVVWWSVFTTLTGAATGLWVLIAVRFLFGAGEAGALPNIARVLGRWFPFEQRGRVQSIVITSVMLGGALAPAAAAKLIEWVGWRWTFALFGTIGLAWAAAFYSWFRDDPNEHPAVNDAERRLIGVARIATADAQRHPSIPWKLVLVSPNVWLMGLIQSCASFFWYMLMNWYPTYLIESRDIDETKAGYLSSLVLSGAAVGSLSGGFISDWLVRRTGSPRWSYSGYGATALLLAAIFLLASIRCPSPTAACVCAALAAMTALSQQASWWGIVNEISGRHLGALFGLMNSLGVPGAFVSTVFLGHFANWMKRMGYAGRDQWDPAFYVYAGVLLVGCIGYLLVDCRRSAVANKIP
jgi:sugar phosphate permease